VITFTVPDPRESSVVLVDASTSEAEYWTTAVESSAARSTIVIFTVEPIARAITPVPFAMQFEEHKKMRSPEVTLVKYRSI
jgi:hypothetical protein